MHCYTLILFISFIGHFTIQATLEISLNVNINVKRTIRELDERFLSVTLDSGIVRSRWNHWNFNSTRLRTLARALSPCYLRLGGTDADFLVFDPTKTSPQNDPEMSKFYENIKVEDKQLDTCDGWKFCEPKNTTNFKMTGADWDDINQFAVESGWKMLFDFNVLLSKGKNWSPANAALLLKYTKKRKYASNIDFELGNEPNAFPHNFNRSISGQQLGKDFQTLKNLLAQYGFSDSAIVGPDITDPFKIRSKSAKFLKDFLPVAGNIIYAVTWHQYYLNGRIATLDNFTDPTVLDKLKSEIKVVHKVLKRDQMTGKTVWMGETSSAFGGGARGLSDSYVAGFLWLDKLGVAATHGMDIVMRQSFVRGHYALLDNDLKPRPDYWLSLLFKQLVGRRVLHVSYDDPTGKIRLYAHCTAVQTARSLVQSYNKGAVTLFGLNLKDEEVKISGFVNKEVHQYLLTPHTTGKLKSHLVRLNSKTLKMVDDVTFPAMKPYILKRGSPVVIPAKTFGFYVLVNAHALACI